MDKRPRESQEEKDCPSSYLRRKRRFGAARAIAPLAGADGTQIKAQTRHGIVEMTVPLLKRSPPERIRITPTAG